MNFRVFKFPFCHSKSNLFQNCLLAIFYSWLDLSESKCRKSRKNISFLSWYLEFLLILWSAWNVVREKRFYKSHSHAPIFVEQEREASRRAPQHQKAGNLILSAWLIRKTKAKEKESRTFLMIFLFVYASLKNCKL